MRPVPCGLDALIGASATMQRLKRRVARLIPTSVAVLIQGETGTGKELLARAIHEDGPRRGGPFVPVNCGALSPELVDAELFGHERGAFTGAIARRGGRVAEAHGGTLFLDEIGELAPASQCKLLRLLQEGEVQRVGNDRPLAVDVRIVAATNRDLVALVARAAFRADCYYRLAGFTVNVPPLRERESDVVVLAERMLARFALELGRLTPRLRGEACAALRSHSWPGNVRELENVVREVVLYCDDAWIGADDVRAALGTRREPPWRVLPVGIAPSGPAPDVGALLRRCNGNVTRAAVELGVSRPTLYKRMRELGIDYAAYRVAPCRLRAGA
jgi:DNA-binding NtrC family response regulator